MSSVIARPTFSRALASLVVVGLVCAVMWRAELEWHGWGGLVWIHYIHWAVPAGVLLFITWACSVVPLAASQRARLATILILVAVPMYVVAQIVLSLAFLAGPRAMFFRLPFGPFAVLPARVIALVPVLPLLVAVIARRFGPQASRSARVASAALWMLAPWLAMTLLAWLPHRGGDDAIHTLKTGVIIPLLVVSLGIPFLPAPRADIEPASPL